MPQAPDPGPPPKTRLGKLLRDHPEAREPLRRAVGGLLGAVLATIVAICILAIWHLRRRADRLRAGRGSPDGCDLNPPDPRIMTDEDHLA